MIKPPTAIPKGFTTQRLALQHWGAVLRDRDKKAALYQSLSNVLSPIVTADLPPSMQVTSDADAIENWVAARVEESDVLTVTDRKNGTLLGLLILVETTASAAKVEVHLGYLLAQNAWGRGLATELITGLIGAMHSGPKAHLIGGVARSNPASARVLQKCGFTELPDRGTMDTMFFGKAVPN